MLPHCRGYAINPPPIVLAIILILQQKTALLVQASAGDWARGVLFGAINPFAYYLVLLQAYDLLPAQQAQPLNYSYQLHREI
ncbi:hypothetical protein [Desulfobacter latus]|uniref:Uncharacterized protein n=1 Tax=Desulfobacter latus TaxID=2292 RepID=A0A850T4B8_9BACT|nr:hypothetical protein [Desulfobacter latus]NWH06613.1 hypothetical protein [Desulfobacter latus]